MKSIHKLEYLNSKFGLKRKHLYKNNKLFQCALHRMISHSVDQYRHSGLTNMWEESHRRRRRSEIEIP